MERTQNSEKIEKKSVLINMYIPVKYTKTSSPVVAALGRARVGPCTPFRTPSIPSREKPSAVRSTTPIVCDAAALATKKRQTAKKLKTPPPLPNVRFIPPPNSPCIHFFRTHIYAKITSSDAYFSTPSIYRSPRPSSRLYSAHSPSEASACTPASTHSSAFAQPSQAKDATLSASLPAQTQTITDQKPLNSSTTPN